MFSLVAKPSILFTSSLSPGAPFFHRLSAYGNFLSAFWASFQEGGNFGVSTNFLPKKTGQRLFS
jgi:hypothetical protein